MLFIPQSKHKKKLLIVFPLLLLAGLIYLWISSNSTPESEIILKNDEYVSKHVIIEGEWLCLPYKKEIDLSSDTCEVGIKTNKNIMYALDTALIEGDRTRLENGDQVRIEGLLVPIEEISNDYWHRYDIQGIMKVELLEKL